MKILAIDPGLAAAGFALLEVTGYGRWTYLAAHTIRTKAGDPLAYRVRDLAEGVDRWNGWDVAVIEVAGGSKPFGGAGAVQINKLMMATGAIMLAASRRSAVVDEVSVQKWWPRRGKKMWSEAEVLERIRGVVPELNEHSEHAATAAALGDWWTRSIGIRFLEKGCVA